MTFPYWISDTSDDNKELLLKYLANEDLGDKKPILENFLQSFFRALKVGRRGAGGSSPRPSPSSNGTCKNVPEVWSLYNVTFGSL